MSLSEYKTVTAVSTMAAAGFVLFAPGQVEASFGEQTLRFGMEQPEVAELQTMLKEKGYFTYHTATGYFGTITEEAVKQFQRDHQLTADGVVGPLTFNKLNAASAVSENQPPSSSSSIQTANTQASAPAAGQISTQRTLREGTRGDDVRALQEALKQKGFFSHHTATGYYGSLTKAAVTDYQRTRNLQVDGLAGSVTITTINNELRSSGGSSSSSSSTGSTSGSQAVASPSSSSTQILREGARGTAVRELQTELKQLGHYHMNITGIYGPQTKGAVTAFQRSQGITADGIAGPQTFQSLEKAKSNSSQSQNNTSSSTQSSSGSFLLKEGDSGSQVRELQERLKATGHYSYSVTGVFGPITKNAVVSFQRRWSMVVDGVVTTSVWDRVEEVSSIHMGSATGGSSSSQAFNVMNLMADAANQIGVPYVWGGTTISGFDCSGFVQYVFRQNGLQLPRTVAEQYRAISKVSTPRPGDLVFFETYRAGPSHNGIYIGNNQFIHAGSSTGVTIANLESNYWKQRYLGAGRINR